MKPPTSGQTAAIVAGLIGVISFYVYGKPYAWLGALAGGAFGLVTFLLLSGRRMRMVRRIFIVSVAIVVWLDLFLTLEYIGIPAFLEWVSIHNRFYYIPSVTSVGFSYIPCTRFLPQLIYGTAIFGQYNTVGTTVVFPSTLESLVLLMIPYIATLIFFGRGWCGWMCYFGGTVEACAGGSNQRWKLGAFRQKFLVEGHSVALGGLKDEVRDIKYGFLLGTLLLLTALVTPVFCIVCWAVWFQFPVLLAALFVLFVAFVAILPFMTKKRWWCLICPVGTLAELGNHLSPFRVKIDSTKCTKCYDCIYDCHTYAITPETIETTFKPNADCDKCGLCMESCPDDAIDLYWRDSNRRARGWFIPLVVGATAMWYSWFAIEVAQLLPMILGKL